MLAFVFTIQHVEQAKSKQSVQDSVPPQSRSSELDQATPASTRSEHQAALGSAGANADAPRAETRPILKAVLNQPVSIEHGGALRELALAKDELYVHNSDGIGRVVSIPSASNASELLGQIEKLQKENGSTPELILYPPGATRDDSTRRIVTRDILIEADSRSAADSLASASGLSFFVKTEATPPSPPPTPPPTAPSSSASPPPEPPPHLARTSSTTSKFNPINCSGGL